MMKKTLTILVAGATGQQGGSVVDGLLASGHKVRGLTRNTSSDKAKALQERGVELAKGDLLNKDSLETAMKGVDGFFLVTTFFEAGLDAEVEQGIVAANTAKKMNIRHLVFSSVSDANQSTGVPHFDSKFKIEEHIKSLALNYTIVAPVYFYDNMLSPFTLPGLQQGTFAMAMPPDKPLKSISVKTIGQFVSLAFSQPEPFLNKRINIAGDELTGPEYAKELSQATNKDITYTSLPIEEVRAMSDDMATMYEWFTLKGYSPTIKELLQTYPDIQWESFEEWANRQDWSVLESTTKV